MAAVWVFRFSLNQVFRAWAFVVVRNNPLSARKGVFLLKGGKQFMLNFSTIAAIATPWGEGGIGLVRISGEEALPIARQLFQSPQGDNWFRGSHRLYYGHLHNLEGQVLDEVLLSVMLAPHSYTREDVVEINCHGGMKVIQEILAAVLAAGARLAKPGEFTQRAFLNGRLDLAQAEAVIDLIRADTRPALQIALNQLAGDLSQRIQAINEEILDLLAEIEVNLDYPDEELEERNRRQIQAAVHKIGAELDRLLEQAEQGKIYREGVQTVIIGRPNVGKSSLLNALLGEEKAIVTEIPGTTRDLIEEVYLVQGIPLKLVDTAGLRDSQDPIEQIGIAKTRSRLEQADLIILMLEAGQSLGEAEQEILAAATGKTLLVVLNKVDLQPQAELDCAWPWVKISAKTGIGLEELKETLAALLLKGELNAPGKILVSNLRHRDILQKARQFLRDFGVSLEAGLALDVADQDLRLAWEALGEICGTTFTEDLLDRIFSNFCLGK